VIEQAARPESRDALLLALPLGSCGFPGAQGDAAWLSKLFVPVAHLLAEGRWIRALRDEMQALRPCFAGSGCWCSVVFAALAARSSRTPRDRERRARKNPGIHDLPGHCGATFSGVRRRCRRASALAWPLTNKRSPRLLSSRSPPTAAHFTVFVPECAGRGVRAGVVLGARERVRMLERRRLSARRRTNEANAGSVCRNSPRSRWPDDPALGAEVETDERRRFDEKDRAYTGNGMRRRAALATATCTRPAPEERRRTVTRRPRDGGAFRPDPSGEGSLFGEQHLHRPIRSTPSSAVARLTPSDAYASPRRRGGGGCQKVRLKAPLDGRPSPTTPSTSARCTRRFNKGRRGTTTRAQATARAHLARRAREVVPRVRGKNNAVRLRSTRPLRRPGDHGRRLEGGPRRRRGALQA